MNVERRLECLECKKTPAILFTEVNGDSINHYHMCKDCPCWQSEDLQTNNIQSAPKTGVCCGNCGTTMEGVWRGQHLGCSQCYDVFADVLQTGIFNILGSKARHSGREPGEQAKVNPSLRLFALNEALQETLAREAYEEAARIRDEIRAVMEKTSEK